MPSRSRRRRKVNLQFTEDEKHTTTTTPRNTDRLSTKNQAGRQFTGTVSPPSMMFTVRSGGPRSYTKQMCADDAGRIRQKFTEAEKKTAITPRTTDCLPTQHLPAHTHTHAKLYHTCPKHGSVIASLAHVPVSFVHDDQRPVRSSDA